MSNQSALLIRRVQQHKHTRLHFRFTRPAATPQKPRCSINLIQNSICEQIEIHIFTKNNNNSSNTKFFKYGSEFSLKSRSGASDSTKRVRVKGANDTKISVFCY